MKKFELDLKWNKENYHFPRNLLTYSIYILKYKTEIKKKKNITSSLLKNLKKSKVFIKITFFIIRKYIIYHDINYTFIVRFKKVSLS